MKKGAGKAKGGAFERLICRKLSLWWTNGKRDDVFARTASSGGRATQRSKKGKSTFGQYGDIQAADPIGQPLIDLCAIECKDGYASDSIADLLDKEPRHNPAYERFIQQSEKSSNDAKTEYWVLIARRRGRKIILFMPVNMYDSLADSFHADMDEVFPVLSIQMRPMDSEIIGVPLESFLANVSPKAIR